MENDLGVPDLPLPCTAGGAAIVGRYVYLVAGQVQRADGEKAASRIVWRLSLSQLKQNLQSDVNSKTELWQRVVSWPDEGPRRMFAQVTAQHDGFGDRLYVFGGRRFLDGSDQTDLTNLQATTDGWVFDPSKFDPLKFGTASGDYLGDSPWKRIADSPVPLTAGTAVPYGPAHIVMPGAATMEILHEVVASGIEMKDFDHPGFPRTTYAYHTVTDTWTDMGPNEGTHVTTPAVRWGKDIFLVSGEVRPRVRTNKVWRIRVKENSRPFGALNMGIVVAYLCLLYTSDAADE